eukprot:10053711-Karenia_brevis.AAC.1
MDEMKAAIVESHRASSEELNDHKATKLADSIDQRLQKKQERLKKDGHELQRYNGGSLLESCAAQRIELVPHRHSSDDLKAAIMESYKA